MSIIQVEASARRYEVVIERGLIDRIGTYAKVLGRRGTAAVVTDSTVDDLYGDRVCASLEQEGFRVVRYVFQAGEASKNAAVLLDLLEFLAEQQVTRSDTLFALGGGVTGDMTGLAAALYLRGVAYVQIPTTLLAAVDSSVGGKTAIDLKHGKNLCGAFYPPWLVLYDPNTAKTLSPEIMADGAAEIIKYAMIRSASLAEKLIQHPMEAILEEIVAECVRIKRDVVSADEFDQGERQILNFGHTLGHAIEACSAFAISHGHAVTMGMGILTRACVREGKVDPEVLTALEAMLKRYGLASTCPDYDTEALMQMAASDKKRKGDSITLVLPTQLGACALMNTDFDTLRRLLELGRKED